MQNATKANLRPRSDDYRCLALVHVRHLARATIRHPREMTKAERRSPEVKVVEAGRSTRETPRTCAPSHAI